MGQPTPIYLSLYLIVSYLSLSVSLLFLSLLGRGSTGGRPQGGRDSFVGPKNPESQRGHRPFASPAMEGGPRICRSSKGAPLLLLLLLLLCL